MIGHTRSGGFCSKISEADVVADARDMAGGDSGSIVPDGVEHRGEARFAGILGVRILSNWIPTQCQTIAARARHMPHDMYPALSC